MNRFTIISAVLGMIFMVAGAAWIYRPLGPLSCGALLMVAAFMSMRHKGTNGA